MRRRSPTTPSSGMRLGLCAQLNRLWIRLVTKTVLPERLKPVTASQTVALLARSPKLPDTRSDAWTKIGGSQPQFIIGDISDPIFVLSSTVSPPSRNVRDNRSPEWCSSGL